MSEQRTITVRVDGGRRGVRHVLWVDHDCRGKRKLVGPDLPTGEHELPLGAVLVAHHGADRISIQQVTEHGLVVRAHRDCWPVWCPAVTEMVEHLLAAPF